MITNFILIMVVLKLASSVPQLQLPNGMLHPQRRPQLRPEPLPQNQYASGLTPYAVHVSPTQVQSHGLQYTQVNPNVFAPRPYEVPVSPAQFPSKFTVNQVGCQYSGVAYGHGDLLNKACLIFQCHRGSWSFQDIFRAECGSCLVHGEPHIYTYELNTNNDEPNRYNQSYTYSGVGEYSLTQQSLVNPDFYINANFGKCAGDQSCIKGLTYTQPGITIKVSDTHTATPKVHMRKDGQVKEEILDDIAVHVQAGTVLVYRGISVPGIHGDIPVNCITIVGSVGLSVSFCENANNYNSAYIWAMPSLKHKAKADNGLYGLCDQYTEYNPAEYALDYHTMKDGTEWRGPSVAFADTWKV